MLVLAAEPAPNQPGQRVSPAKMLCLRVFGAIARSKKLPAPRPGVPTLPRRPLASAEAGEPTEPSRVLSGRAAKGNHEGVEDDGALKLHALSGIIIALSGPKAFFG